MATNGAECFFKFVDYKFIQGHFVTNSQNCLKGLTKLSVSLNQYNIWEKYSDPLLAIKVNSQQKGKR